MRLTCPNCGAQYEVPTEVIPPEGRDVQCSNCGQTWFQDHSDPDADTAPEPVEADDFGPEPGFDTEPAPELEAADWDDAEDEAEDDVPEPRTGRNLDPAISNILQQEAAREAELRAHEAEALESQPNLGLDDVGDDETSRRARESQDRMARMRGEEPIADQALSEAGSRSGLLPDIEEINSSLRTDEDGAVVSAPATVSAHGGRRSGGFMRGFTLMILFGVILAVLYLNAPAIAQRFPQADPMLSAYVALVDQARLWLDGQAAAFLPR